MEDAFDPETFTSESREIWSAAAVRYEKLAEALLAPIAEQFVDFARLKAGSKVLEVACGPGTATRLLARRVGSTGSVLATDFAPGMIALAKSRPQPKGGAAIEWRVLDAQDMDLPDGAFDAVVCELGLMLFAKPHDALAEMRRVVKPGGTVACLVQGRRGEMRFTGCVMDAMVGRAPQLKAPPGAPTIFAFGPDGVLEQALQRAGLTRIAYERLNGTFPFTSAEEYWTTMTEGAGKTGAMLRSLSPEAQAQVKADVLRRAEACRADGGVAIPYEFAMARGRVPF